MYTAVNICSVWTLRLSTYQTLNRLLLSVLLLSFAFQYIWYTFTCAYFVEAICCPTYLGIVPVMFHLFKCVGQCDAERACDPIPARIFAIEASFQVSAF